METKSKWFCLFLVLLNQCGKFVEAQEDVIEANPNLKTYQGNKDTILYDSNIQRVCNSLCNCSNNSGRDNIRQNLEEIIKALLRDGLSTRVEAISNTQYDLNGDIQDAADKIYFQILSSTRYITGKIDSAIREKSILESINNLITLTSLEKNIGQIDPSKGTNELAEKIKSISTNTIQLIDNNKEQLNSMETTNKRLIFLEEKSNLLEKNFEKLLNISEDIQGTAAKSYQGIEILLTDVPESENGTRLRDVLCKGQIPKSLKLSLGPWIEGQVPVDDNLDKFMVERTGCSYTALETPRNFDMPAAYYNGNSYEWRVLVRAHEEADFGISWGTFGYSLFIGQESNTITTLNQWNSQNPSRNPTPGILGADRYLPVYVKISNGVLSVGTDCSDKPIATRDVTITRGQQITRLFKTWSTRGAKFLYNCPSNFLVSDVPRG